MAIVSEVINRIPVEKLLSRAPDNKKRLEELQEILGRADPVHLSHKEDEISTKETVAYQNREISKLLLRMEGHCTQKFRLFGKICDCGAQKHLLDLESLCEETVPMVDNPDIYYQVIELGKELSPKCLPEAVATLQYDDEFPSYARRYRDLRKKLIGSLDPTEIEKPEPGQYFPEEVRANE